MMNLDFDFAHLPSPPIMVKVDIEASGRDKFEIGMYSLALHIVYRKLCITKFGLGK